MLSVVILAGGKGSRIKSSKNKPLVNISGKPLLSWTLDAIANLTTSQIIIVAPKEHSEFKTVIEKFNPESNDKITWAVQEQALGTADAVKSALPHVKESSNKLLIMCADVPFVQTRELAELTATDQLSILTSLVEDPGSMGRIKRVGTEVKAIIEASDASVEELQINEVFSGIMSAPLDLIQNFINTVDNNNNQGEFYLTDIIKTTASNGKVNAIIARPAWTTQGVNTLENLINLERQYSEHVATCLIENGVRIIDKKRFDCRGKIACQKEVTIDINVIIKGEVQIGNNSYIGPGCVLEDCIIEDNVVIAANSVVTKSHIKANTSVGPFAYIRPNCQVSENCRIGSFVELKNSTIGNNSKVPHLSYIGDCTIGKFVNIGAGVITCNYDGLKKHKTLIADYCFIGAGVQLIAPVTINQAAVIGAGTCIRQDLASNTLAVNKYQVKLVSNWRKGE